MKTIVMTGATSGIGKEAVQRLAQQPGTRIIVGARGRGRIVPEGTEVFPLDLTSLESVRSFAASVKKQLGDTTIDVLVLNAAVQAKDNQQQSADGFELMFAVNHLSHYLLARLLWPHMTASGVIVFTTSDTHDPALIPFAPKTLDPHGLANPQKKEWGMRAYAASKLCNLLTARSFAAINTKEGRGISVIAYNPGLTGGTSLTGKPSRFMRILLPLVLRPLSRVVSLFKPPFFVGTPERAGGVLANLASGEIRLPEGRVYASLVRGKVTFPDPSQLAQRDEVKDLLWRASAKMVGLSER
ncbi:SDR family NAD(P)-dependent oxidoreductase [Parapedobacter luteus]|nr:SDR family NAD(P)-dependent oxidoreductase [Parapedobacter luteus]